MCSIRKLASSAFLISILLQASCSSIDRSSEIERAQLIVGTSSKNDVVRAIGLPDKIQRDGQRDVELWLYSSKAASSSYFVPVPIASVPTGPNLMTTYFADVGPKNIANDEPFSLICVFDKTGRLLDLQRPGQEHPK